MKVTLTTREMLIASQAGAMRRVEGIHKGRVERWGVAPEGRWDRDIEGAGAEMAVAKAIGLYWQPVVADPATLPGDVGQLQVRTTSRPDGSLILHPSDPDDARFYLVTGLMPHYHIAGSIIGGIGKDAEYWRENVPHPAFFVPQEALAPVELEVEVAA